MIRKGTSEGSYILTIPNWSGSVNEWDLDRGIIGCRKWADWQLKGFREAIQNLPSYGEVISQGIGFTRYSDCIGVRTGFTEFVKEQDLLDAITIALGEPYACPV